MQTACLIVIGNEILSGRTQDRNLAWLAKSLNDIGIRLMEARVIPDVEDTIVAAVNECRRKFAYVFTTGGIGPTHDDITVAAIAKAFGVKVERNAGAEAILEKHYGRDKLTPPRLKMADMPQGARLVVNAVSGAPGFHMENVFVFAGVPAIMQAMFDAVKPLLKGGAPMLSKYISAYLTESMIAEPLTAIQARHKDVEIGSYPFLKNTKLGVCLAARATDAAKLDAAYADIKAMLHSLTKEVVEEDLAA